MSTWEEQLPYATGSIPAIPGTIKSKREDFQVEEIPAYEPSGQGSHLYFLVKKTGLSTARAVRDIARALGVRPQDVGCAGMKDARAISTQRMSVEHIGEEKLLSVSLPRITLVPLGRHGNKLRMGHLKGNRFRIRIRGTDIGRVGDAELVLSRLSSYGVPNYFGPQRFGNRGDTWKIGRALLVSDFDGAAAEIAGRPSELDKGDVLRARQLFGEGNYREAALAWPPGFHECVSVCRNMEKYDGDAQKAVMRLDRKSLGFYVSACQSWLFNQILAERIDELDAIETGDVAWKHLNGAQFLVEDGQAELSRATCFEISATGPLFGPKMKTPSGRPGMREANVIGKSGLTPEHFNQKGPLRCPGGRRPLRFPLHGASVAQGSDEDGEFLELCFDLPTGCYATAVVREICKTKLVDLARE